MGDTAWTQSRAAACMDQLNFVSHAVTMRHTLGVGSETPVLAGNIISMDEFAVNLGKVKEIAEKVKTTATAKKEMAAQNKSLKNPGNKKFQKKVSMAKLTISLAISPSGQVLAGVYAIREGDFKLKKAKKDADAAASTWTYKCSSMTVQCTTH